MTKKKIMTYGKTLEEIKKTCIPSVQKYGEKPAKISEELAEEPTEISEKEAQDEKPAEELAEEPTETKTMITS